MPLNKVPDHLQPNSAQINTKILDSLLPDVKCDPNGNGGQGYFRRASSLEGFESQKSEVNGNDNMYSSKLSVKI